MLEDAWMNTTAPDRSENNSRWLPWVFVLLPAFLFLANLGGAPLFDVDEGAFSEATREMFERGDFLSTWLNGAPRFDKPILIYWCQAAFFWLLGPSEWAFRLPSALAGMAWSYAVGFFAWQRFGRAAGVIACGVVATCIGPHLIGRAATADALLNMLIALSMLDAWRYLESGRRAPLLRSYLWIALGILTKGPIAVLVPGAVTLLFAATTGQWKTWLRSVFDPIGWLILFAVAAPWYGMAYAIHGQAFIDGFLLKHNVQRFSGSLEGHSGSIFYYLLMVPVLLLPWLSWLLAMLRKLPSDLRAPLPRFLWIWSGFVIAFFSISGTKLPHYALYGCTPLFLLIAIHRNVIRRAWIGTLPVLAFIALFAALPALLTHATTSGWINDPLYHSLLSRITELQLKNYFLVCGAALIVAIVFLLRHKQSAAFRQLGCAAMATAVLAFAVAPLLGELIQGPTHRAALVARSLGEPVMQWKIVAPSFSVYREAQTPVAEPASGQIALSRVDRVPTGVAYDALFSEGGIVLLRIR